jgi:hypothetical protein
VVRLAFFREISDSIGVLITPLSNLRRWLVTGAFVCLAVWQASAAGVAIIPVADTSILSGDPGNSMGKVEWLLAGIIQNRQTNRTLMKFDVAAAVPRGSKIQAATFYISVNRQASDELKHSFYELRRMLRPWGEGTNYWSDQIGEGHGTPAGPGGATWLYSFFATNAWAAPGAAEGIDFSEEITSSTFINSTEVFEFEGTPQMLADIQVWLDNPGTNFGWMLKSEAEARPDEVFASAKRFTSREEPANAPLLAITYTPPPQITAPTMTNGTIQFSFDADAGGIYSVEARAALAGTNTWSVVTNFGFALDPTNFTARIPTNGTQQFFRVRVD